MSSGSNYKPKYDNSLALIIGINDYKKASPLNYAKNDAESIADILSVKFNFPTSHIKLLVDDDATHKNITDEFLKFTSKKVNSDDRIIFFFAGHGHTESGNRGDIGFLVPVDGDIENLNTLIRWDQLISDSELIPAKHLLFIMDACYGGLAFARYISPGSMRFLKNMMQRYSRQVLTAGKADELVSDSGGPIPNHSVFTGHLINALNGDASTKEGILTGNSVMSYVYDRVATDYQSRQTPSYGHVDGDGDFIFDTTEIDKLPKEETKDNDILIELPAVSHTQEAIDESSNLSDLIKEYLSDKKYLIKLDDLVSNKIRNAIYELNTENFPTQGNNINIDGFDERIKKYETIISELQIIIILISKWGDIQHQGIIERIFSRLGNIEPSNGLTLWLALRWYPIQLLIYSGGIAALSANNYKNLSLILTTKILEKHNRDIPIEVIIPTTEEMLDVQRTDIFKKLQGHENQYVPRSEYLFKVLQPQLEDLLFLGNSYENLFDKFEIMIALVFADLTFEQRDHVWGPVGRFGWKFCDRTESNPFISLTEEAEKLKNDWAPIKSGLFQSSYERFKQISNEYLELLKRLNWY